METIWTEHRLQNGGNAVASHLCHWCGQGELPGKPLISYGDDLYHYFPCLVECDIDQQDGDWYDLYRDITAS